MILSGKLKVLRRGLKAWSQEISKLYKLINNSSYVLALLDGLEEQRTLPLIERNFRQLLKSHLLNLLEAKRVYWKQRATIRWVQFEDENTKLFHSIATQKFRRNCIATLQALDGSIAIDLEHKAAILWNCFKDRLGQSEFQSMLCELDSLIQPIDLSHLDAPFSIDEIDAIVKDLPVDKTPGPGGFNGLFIKKCWPLINEDFYGLFT
jgi:hypothetical protein